MSENKKAMITGASRGIGKSIALRLAKDGYDIIIVDLSVEGAKDAQQEIQSLGVNCGVHACDVSSFDDTAQLIKDCVEAYGRIDVLVNNAGITKDTLLPMMSEDAFDKVIAVNLKGCFNMTRHIARHMMRNRSGAIINISSVVGITGNAGQANYSSSKAGLIGLTKTSAKELGARGIRVNAVAPGFIETDMTHVLKEEHKKAFIDNIPLKRSGSAEDVAKAVAFLASEESSYITGQVLVVDGGMVM